MVHVIHMHRSRGRNAASLFSRCQFQIRLPRMISYKKLHVDFLLVRLIPRHSISVNLIEKKAGPFHRSFPFDLSIFPIHPFGLSHSYQIIQDLFEAVFLHSQTVSFFKAGTNILDGA